MATWKGTPITVSLLAFIVTAVIGVYVFALRGEGHVKGVVKETLRQHCEQDVDRAHTDLPQRYVPRHEVQQQLTKMDGRLQRIEWSQQQVLDKLKRRERRRPNR